MQKLRTISESIQIISESHTDTDLMTYADGIAKALQLQKTELGNVWTAEIINGESDYDSGNGSGTIKYIRPAVPDEVQYRVEVTRPMAEPTIDEEGNEIPGDDTAGDTGDVKITVSINDNPAVEETFNNLALVTIKETVTSFVIKVVNEAHQQQKVNEAKGKIKKDAKGVNEDANLAVVAAGVAAVIGSGVGIAGLMDYLKKKYPKAYAALTKMGDAAAGSRAHGVNTNESSANMSDGLLDRVQAMMKVDKNGEIQEFLAKYAPKKAVEQALKNLGEAELAALEKLLSRLERQEKKKDQDFAAGYKK